MQRETGQDVKVEISFGLMDFEKTASGTVLVKKVNKFSSLGKAGIGAGDEILAMDGVVAKSPEEAGAILRAAGIGGSVDFLIRRAGEELHIPVKLLKKRRLNLQLDEVDASLERKIAP